MIAAWRTHDSAPSARPVVTAADALDDGDWFSRPGNRRRVYRVRQASPSGWWIVRRRRGGVFLRVWTPSLPRMPDNDASLRSWWFRVAWPSVPPKARHALIVEAARNEGGMPATSRPAVMPARARRLDDQQIHSPITDIPQGGEE